MEDGYMDYEMQNNHQQPLHPPLGSTHSWRRCPALSSSGSRTQAESSGHSTPWGSQNQASSHVPHHQRLAPPYTLGSTVLDHTQYWVTSATISYFANHGAGPQSEPPSQIFPASQGSQVFTASPDSLSPPAATEGAPELPPLHITTRQPPSQLASDSYPPQASVRANVHLLPPPSSLEIPTPPVSTITTQSAVIGSSARQPDINRVAVAAIPVASSVSSVTSSASSSSSTSQPTSANSVRGRHRTTHVSTFARTHNPGRAMGSSSRNDPQTSPNPVHDDDSELEGRLAWTSRAQIARQTQLLRGQMSNKKVASRQAIKSLQEVDVNSLPENERTCVICYNDFGVSSPEGTVEAPLRLPKCKHVFGNHCILKWLQDSYSCPYCRDQLESESVRPDEATMRRLIADARRDLERSMARTQNYETFRRSATRSEIRSTTDRIPTLSTRQGDRTQTSDTPSFERDSTSRGERRAPPEDPRDIQLRRQRPRHESLYNNWEPTLFYPFQQGLPNTYSPPSAASQTQSPSRPPFLVPHPWYGPQGDPFRRSPPQSNPTYHQIPRPEQQQTPQTGPSPLPPFPVLNLSLSHPHSYPSLDPAPAPAPALAPVSAPAPAPATGTATATATPNAQASPAEPHVDNARNLAGLLGTSSQNVATAPEPPVPNWLLRETPALPALPEFFQSLSPRSPYFNINSSPYALPFNSQYPEQSGGVQQAGFRYPQ